MNSFIEWFLVFMIDLKSITWRSNLCLVPVGLVAEPSFGSWKFFASSEEKTEAATPHRRQEARKKGQVARSSDLNAGIVLMAIIMLMYSLRGYLGLNITGYVQYMLSTVMTSNLNSEQFFNIFKLTLYLCFKIMAPIFAIAIVFGLLANFLQVGFMFAAEGMKPKLSNINPLEGLKKMFSKKALFEFLKTLLKVGVIGLIVYNLVKSKFPTILLLINMDIVTIINFLEKLIYQIGTTAVGVFLVIATLDFAYQKWEFGQSLKMSKDEVKKEMKQNEGDPLIKGRLREKQRLMSMRRMMHHLPEATVVVTNPTHLAVALKYDGDVMQAPQIIAKGAGYVAEKMREKAGEYNIPIIQDRPLARSLYKGSEIGDYVPVELYQAVAGILAAIYSLKRDGGARNSEI